MHARLLLALLLAPPAIAQEPASSDVAATPSGASLQQEVLPELARRTSSANARIASREAWFEGTQATLGSAFVHLAGASLNDPVFLRARRLALEQAARERAVEGMQAPESSWSPEEAASWLEARTAALAAEERADQLEATLLGRLESAWQRAPGLARPAADATSEHLAQGLAAAEADPEEDATPWALAIQRQEELVQAAVRSATIAGDTSLAALVTEDLQVVAAAQAAGEQPPVGSLERLTAAQPLVPTLPGLDEVLVQGRRDELEAELVVLGSPEVDPLPTDPEALAQLLVEADAALVGPAEVPSVPATLRPLAEEVAQARRAALEARRDRIAAALANPDATTSTQADVEQARERARSAQERADEADDTHSASAKISAQVATFAAEELDLREAEVAAQEQATTELAALEERQGAVSAQHLEALGMGVLAPERQRGFDKAYADAVALVTDVRTLVQDRRKRVFEAASAATARRAELPPASAVQGVSGPEREQWLEAREGVVAALEAREASARAALDRALILLKRVKSERRQVRPDASGVARSQDSRDFLAQAYAEVTEWPLLVASTARRVWASRADLPERLVDLSMWWTLFTRSTELLLLGLAWLVTRGRLEGWWSQALRALEGARYEREDTTMRRLVEWLDRITTNGDWRHLAGPLGRVSRYLTDALLGGAILWVFGESAPFVGLLALLWQLRALYLGLPEVVLLVFNASAAPAPALVNTTMELRERAAATTRWVLLWWSIDRGSRYFTLHVMDADRIHTIVGTISTLGGLALAVYALFVWSTEVRAAVGRAEQDNLTRVLSRDSPSRVLAAPLAAAGLAWLGGRWVVRAISALVEQRAGLAWLSALLARQRLKTAESLPQARLPRTTRAAIRSAHAPLDFPAALDELATHHSAVLAGNSRGLVAVISDPGFSDGLLLRRFDDSLAETVKAIDVEPGTHQLSQALAWLGEVMGIEGAGALGTEELIEELLAQEPEVVFVRHTEHLFLRAVGGYTALREILRVLHATADHHRWVVEFHGPAWDLLSGVRAAVDLDVFVRVVRLQPATAPRMSEWLLTNTKKAGYQVTFRHLVADGVLGTETEKALERTEAAWWRLLADATGGNPGAALEAWLDSLREEEPGKLAVALLELPRATDLDTCADRELFVLTALVVHRGLTVEDLSRSLNMPPGACRSACRSLQGQGVLSRLDDHRWRVRLPWFPAVVRHLRNKHFLHVR